MLKMLTAADVLVYTVAIHHTLENLVSISAVINKHTQNFCSCF